MKKLITVLVLLLVVTGCTSNPASTSISDADTAIVTVNDKTVNKGQLYQMMKAQGIESTIVDLAKVTLVESLIEIDESIEARAQELLESNKEYLGDAFDQIIELNFGSVEEFVELQLIPAARQEALARIYFDENFDSIVAENKPREVMILSVDTTTDGNAIIKGLEAGEDVTGLLEEYGSENASSEPVIIASTSTVPAAMLTFIQEAEIDDISNEPIPDTSGDVYYVVKVLETDAEVLKEDYFSIYITNTSNMNAMYKYYFKKYNFNVYDQKLYDAIRNNKELGDFDPNN